ncbi:hypothetical protein HYH03_013595 [Edaphochlamys debaryana]|uniref:Bacteriophage T5 Orf172 DNA-binding domain-containing protein n=1 Tax=Edaphochlamys debaryana TaxID=47281 RepID=A0A836BSY7_9CHLO|nr:hypothetical protein HYH03_013595 [Edaphochlamys debaryana]|eukprot:KAG2487750.1 hypothetical protein HYH03_013595 [Edaphochlamys debaryana]
MDSFLSMYDPTTIQTDMVIDGEQAATWLGVQKFNLLRTLRENYTEGIDYSVMKQPRPTTAVKKYGGNACKKVLLSPDCFKRVCMLSRSKRAEEVRTYFIEMESLIVRYRIALQKGMVAEIRDLERSLQPPDPADSAGYIYVLRASMDKDSVYKIGRTQDLNKRLSTYNTGSVDGVEVLYKFRTDNHRAVEGCLKAMLREHQYRKYKEVYQADLDMIKRLINECDSVAQTKRVYTSRKAPRMRGGYYVVLSADTAG